MEICNYEIAKKLKEKGFELPTLEVYGKYDSDGLFHSQLYCNYTETMDSDEIIAPTISQVLKWLREEKKIHICVDFDKDMIWYYQIAEYHTTSYKHQQYGYNSYEEAALVGVNCCLDNLI